MFTPGGTLDSTVYHNEVIRKKCKHFLKRCDTITYDTTQRRLWIVVITLGQGLSAANLARLPRECFRYGSMQFLLIYTLLSVLVSFPVVFLELSLGQFCSTEVIRTFKAVPVFQGIGYLKLFTCFIASTYTIIYVGLSAAYFIWIWNGPLPMTECREIHMTPDGYVNHAVGMECFRRTFLKPVSEEGTWYGLVAVIVFLAWFLIPLCLYKLGKTMKKTWSILIIIIAILVITISIGTWGNHLGILIEGEDWRNLGEPKFWHAALVQSLYSTQIGFGFLMCIGGNVYDKVNALKISIAYVAISVIFGWLIMIFWVGTGGWLEQDTSFISVLVLTYEAAVGDERSAVWPCLTYLCIAFSAVISVTIYLYPILKIIKRISRTNWRFISIFTCILAAMVSLIIFSKGLEIITILDDYAVPILVTVTVGCEIIIYVYIYGWKKLSVDIEFNQKSHLHSAWIYYWSSALAIIVILSSWRIFGEYEDGWMIPSEPWGSWLLVGVLIIAALIVVFVGLLVISLQDEFGILQKMTKAFKESKLWGPVDPLKRHYWIEWRNEHHNANSAPNSRNISPQNRQIDFFHRGTPTGSTDFNFSRQSLELSEIMSLTSFHNNTFTTDTRKQSLLSKSSLRPLPADTETISNEGSIKQQDGFSIKTNETSTYI